MQNNTTVIRLVKGKVLDYTNKCKIRQNEARVIA